MNAEQYLRAGIISFLVGAVLPLFPFAGIRRYWYIFSAFGAVSFAVFGLFLCFGLQIPTTLLPLSSFFEFAFTGDALSGFFVVVISLLAFAVALFSVGYSKTLDNRGLMGFLFNLFILSMYAVVLSGNVITFLISWETMTMISYFLVTFEGDDKSAKAGLVYAMMTHIGTAFLVALFLILSSYSGSMDFAAMRAASTKVPEGVASVVFVLSIIGFGTKAGIVPLHTWLPRAHPAAPSNISSLMSGVMIKTGIYGFLRVTMDLMGGGPEWWGISVIAIGAVSSVLGVLYALMEHDLKRLLAYHSVENIGIILLGIGASLMFRSNGLYPLSAIALAAGLYHTLNHALFKGLLFLGAGSVAHAAHTKNMEDMGGLIKSMPYTGALFLIGSVSICALPPFNGFVSEWLTYQALILGYNAPSVTAKIVSPLGGAALALTGALAAACFVKAFGISFLGMPRSSHARDAKESSPSMIAGMMILAVLCLVFGIVPSLAVGLLSPAVFALTGSHGFSSERGILAVGGTASSLSPGLLLVTMGIIMAAALLFVFTAGGRRKVTRRDSWDCGMSSLTPRMQYTATAFTKPVRMIFKRLYLPKRELRVTYIVKPFFVKSIGYSAEITPFFERYIYDPLIDFIHRTARTVRLLQSGSLHLYLGYILITLVLLLMFGN